MRSETSRGVESMPASDEYAIPATNFIRALLEQRGTKMKGGIYHSTQISMAFNSNRIEGSSLDEEQTRYIYETRSLVGFALVNDIVETTNHFKAFDAMLDHVGQPITSAVMKEYHRILKTGTADAENDQFAVGDWKRYGNVVGNVETTPHAEVNSAITQLLADFPQNPQFHHLVKFHHDFEAIHPFQDGNGRVGRLLLFEQCLANDILPFVVLDREKAFYYQGLDRFTEEPGFLIDTFRHFQDVYYQKYRDLVPNYARG